MPTLAQELHSGAVSVADLLADQRRFQVPLYQRHYVWSEEQLTALWKDIDELIDDSAEIRFLGALVLQLNQQSTARKPGRYYVIDGQQRITTMFLLALAIASVAQDMKHPDLAESIATSYLLVTKKTDEHRPKIIPAYPDLRQFNEIMKTIESPLAQLDPPHGDEEGLLYEAFFQLEEQVEARVQKIASEMEEGTREHEDVDASVSADLSYQHLALDYFLDMVMEKIEFIEITLDDRHDPNEVFNRLNTAGQPLGVSDLVRNDVFRRLHDDPSAADQIYHQHWVEFEKSFGSGKGGRRLHDNYYWPFAVATNPTTSRARMFKDLQSRWDGLTKGMTGADVPLKIIEDLGQYAPAYLSIASGIRPDGINDDVWASLLLFSELNLPAVSYPFFINLVSANCDGNCTDENTRAICQIVESFLVRRALVGDEPTGLHAIFKNLWAKSEGDPKLTRKNLVSRTIEFPTDKQLMEAVIERPLYGGRIAPYVIAEYEKELQSNSIEPLASLPEITIDHVMPQTLDGDWKSAVSSEEHEKFLHTWGNLVPLSSKANSLKGNKSWAEAKELLEKETKFLSAKEVLKKREWAASAIKERSKNLVKWACGRWPTFEEIL